MGTPGALPSSKGGRTERPPPIPHHGSSETSLGRVVVGVKGRRRVRPHHMELTSGGQNNNPGDQRIKESLNGLGWE